jgi:hypothetical protein
MQVALLPHLSEWGFLLSLESYRYSCLEEMSDHSQLSRRIPLGREQFVDL